MNLIASVIVKDELDRYLDPFLRHLLAFVDEIRVYDDGSTDDWADRLTIGSDDLERIHVLRAEESLFFEHEGRARQALLDWTLEGKPTHVLAIDADEFVADGAALRARVEQRQAQAVWTLVMEEIWKATDECLCIRQDEKWRERPIPILYRVSQRDLERDLARPAAIRQWAILDRQLAPGREPIAVRNAARTGRIPSVGTEVLHFGWACEPDRADRYERYVEHDGGRFHQNDHLKSIMWEDRRVTLEGRDWPEGLAPIRDELVARVNRV